MESSTIMQRMRERDAEILRRHQIGYQQTEIAGALGITQGIVAGVIRRWRVKRLQETWGKNDAQESAS